MLTKIYKIMYVKVYILRKNSWLPISWIGSSYWLNDELNVYLAC
jgi:hypothetical protein